MAPTDPSKKRDESSARPSMIAPTDPYVGSPRAMKDALEKDSQKKDLFKLLEKTKEDLIKKNVLPAR